MRSLVYIILLQLSLFFLININSFTKLEFDTYVVDGLKLNVDEKTMKLLSDNIYWIHSFNRSTGEQYKIRYDEEGKEIFYYWEDSFNNYDKRKFYCGKRTPDVLCVKDISKYLDTCNFSEHGNIFWKKKDGIYIEWKSSEKKLKETISSCNVELIGNLEKIDEKYKTRNLIITSFILLFLTILPFLFNLREKTND